MCVCESFHVRWWYWVGSGAPGALTRGRGGKFFIAPCLVAGDVSCCQFQNWALSLFPPLFPSLSQAAFRDLCRCMLFITVDRCFNSHQAVADCDPAHSHRHAVLGRKCLMDYEQHWGSLLARFSNPWMRTHSSAHHSRLIEGSMGHINLWLYCFNKRGWSACRTCTILVKTKHRPNLRAKQLQPHLVHMRQAHTPLPQL